MDSAVTDLDGTHQSNDGGKVKKLRKRPKLGSCIPCAKRRQKCDRMQPCSSCVGRGTPHLCKWETIPDGLNPSRSTATRVDVDLTTEGAEDNDANEDEVPPGLRNTKSDLNENRETLMMLRERIQSLEHRVAVASTAGSTSTTFGSRRTSVKLDSARSRSGSGDATQFEGMLQSGRFTGVSPSASTGGNAGSGYFEYVGSTGVGGPVMLQEVAPSTPSITSPSTPQSSHRHASVRPQNSRRQSEASFRVPSVPQDESHNQITPFSLVHRGEFVGQGNILSVLHSIRSLSPLRLPYAKTTPPTSISPPHSVKFAQSLIPSPEVQHLIQYLPSMPSGNAMIDAFLKEVNWRYGIPERWFLNTCNQMWNYLQDPKQGQRLNLYWLCLFFSVLACTLQPGESSVLTVKPPNTHDRSTYFVCASTARRLAEDSYLDQPIASLELGRGSSSPTDGCTLACLAIPLLCDFLAERGRLSEAWKLVGSGIRSAQAAGLHRDPGSQAWQEMSEGEKDLRRRAWWGLYIWDRLYSYVLGRPQMVRGDISDVAKPANVDGKGRKNSFNLSRIVMIQLADLASEILDKCTGVEYPTWAILTEMDTKFQAWESGIPAEFRPGTTQEQDIILFAGLSRIEIQKFTRQRYMITTWYRLTRLKLYALALKQQSPSSLNQRDSPDPIHKMAESCIRCALELIKFQCDTFGWMRRIQSGERWLGGNWYFEGCLSLFEAAVALLLVLIKFPTTFIAPPGANMAEELKKGLKLEYEEMSRVISRVVDVFAEVVKSEKEPEDGLVRDGKRAEFAAKALEALQVLLKEHWWKLDPRGNMGKALLAGTGLSTDGVHGGNPGLQSSISPPSSGPASSPQRQGSSPAMSRAGSGTPFVRPGFAGSTSTMGPMIRMQQQQVQTLGPPTASIPPSVPVQMQYQVYPGTYRDAPTYPMAAYTPSPSTSYMQQSGSPSATTDVSFSFRPPQGAVVGSLMAAGNAAAGYPQTQSPFPSQAQRAPLNPAPLTRDETQIYGTQNPFIPGSDQNQQYQQIPQHLPPPPQLQTFTSNPARSLPLAADSTASGYAYTPTSSVDRVQPLPSPASGIPPPSQGMRMIHYVSPGVTAPSAAVGPMGFRDVAQSSSGVGPSNQQDSTQSSSDFVGTATTGSEGAVYGVTGAHGSYYK